MGKDEDEAKDFKRTFEKKSDFLFLEHWEEGKRPFNWLANWEPLNISLYEIKIADSFVSCEYALPRGLELDLTKGGQPGKADDLIDEEKAKFLDFTKEAPDAEPDWLHGIYRKDFETDAEYEEAIASYIKKETEEKGEEYALRAMVYNKRFRIPDEPHTRAIQAKCSLEDSRSIDMINDGDVNEKMFGGGRYTAGTVSIQPSENAYLGHLGFYDEDDDMFDRTGKTKVGDIWLELYVKPEVFDQLTKRIERLGRDLVCTASLRMLAYQSEVERSLAEPWHSQAYYIEKGEYFISSDVVLESIALSTSEKYGPEPAPGFREHVTEMEDEDGWLEDDEPSAPPSSSPQQTIQVQNKPLRLWPVTLALWAVFFGLIVNAISR